MDGWLVPCWVYEYLSGWVAGVMLGGYVAGTKLPSWVAGSPSGGHKMSHYLIVLPGYFSH